MKNEIVIFENQDVKLEVNMKEETVWLTQAQMTKLFKVKQNTIAEHISNIFEEGELDERTSIGISDKSSGGRKPVIYNLDVIISVGYRVKSQRGIEFRRWANKVLKDYIIKGYALNDKRLQALQKTVEIQTKMLANTMDIEQEDVLKAVNMYTQALTLLDQYDHQSVVKPEGASPIYRITYLDCSLLFYVYGMITWEDL